MFLDRSLAQVPSCTAVPSKRLGNVQRGEVEIQMVSVIFSMLVFPGSEGQIRRISLESFNAGPDSCLCVCHAVFIHIVTHANFDALIRKNRH